LINKALYDIKPHTAVVPGWAPPDVMVGFRVNRRVAGNWRRADIHGDRMRHHENEAVRSQGAWMNRPKGWKFWPVIS